MESKYTGNCGCIKYVMTYKEANDSVEAYNIKYPYIEHKVIHAEAV
jgi:hypothetical protein